MARSLNKVTLIGNLTRDPELRYTPSGTAVCSFGLATNRQWRTDTGEKKEDVEFHRIVAWRKLAELCAQLLKKGRKAYVEGRLQTRKWTGQDEVERKTTEIVINEMILLDSSGSRTSSDDFDDDFDIPDFGESESDSEDKKSAKTDDAEEKTKNNKNKQKNKKKSDKKKSKTKDKEKSDEKSSKGKSTSGKKSKKSSKGGSKKNKSKKQEEDDDDEIPF